MTTQQPTPEESARRSRMADSLARLRAQSGPEPVDVLAVLQRQIDLALSYGNDERGEALRDIHAAIAELIESMPALLALYRIKWGNLDADANAVYERASAAIARVGGGK